MKINTQLFKKNKLWQDNKIKLNFGPRELNFFLTLQINQINHLYKDKCYICRKNVNTCLRKLEEGRTKTFLD